MKRITSRQNPEIIALAKLKKASNRYQQNSFIAEGVRTCSTLVEHGISLTHAYVLENAIDAALEFTPDEKISIVPESVMSKISNATTPSGIVGLFQLPKKPSFDLLSSGIVLANITDPGNMGTLIRTCAALNKKTVVVVEGVDPWNHKVIQASAGTIGSVNIFQCSWRELLDHKKNLALAALVVADGKPIQDAHLDNALLVIGSEAHGIAPEWLNDCATKITLPMPGKTESLNAAIAGSIAMYITWM